MMSPYMSWEGALSGQISSRKYSGRQLPRSASAVLMARVEGLGGNGGILGLEIIAQSASPCPTAEQVAAHELGLTRAERCRTATYQVCLRRLDYAICDADAEASDEGLT
jgi:hypothetical protein